MVNIHNLLLVLQPFRVLALALFAVGFVGWIVFGEPILLYGGLLAGVAGLYLPEAKE